MQAVRRVRYDCVATPDAVTSPRFHRLTLAPFFSRRPLCSKHFAKPAAAASDARTSSAPQVAHGLFHQRSTPPPCRHAAGPFLTPRPRGLHPNSSVRRPTLWSGCRSLSAKRASPHRHCASSTPMATGHPGAVTQKRRRRRLVPAMPAPPHPASASTSWPPCLAAGAAAANSCRFFLGERPTAFANECSFILNLNKSCGRVPGRVAAAALLLRARCGASDEVEVGHEADARRLVKGGGEA